MIELETPQIEPVEEVGTYAKYEVGPLQAGYGVTLGNALRRVLLSSLEGAAVTSLQIRDVYQEFSTIPGVKEDVTQIVLNVKKLRLKSFATHPVQLKLIKSGAGPVTAAAAPGMVVIVGTWRTSASRRIAAESDLPRRPSGVLITSWISRFLIMSTTFGRPSWTFRIDSAFTPLPTGALSNWHLSSPAAAGSISRARSG